MPIQSAAASTYRCCRRSMALRCRRVTSRPPGLTPLRGSRLRLAAIADGGFAQLSSHGGGGGAGGDRLADAPMTRRWRLPCDGPATGMITPVDFARRQDKLARWLASMAASAISFAILPRVGDICRVAAPAAHAAERFCVVSICDFLRLRRRVRRQAASEVCQAAAATAQPSVPLPRHCGVMLARRDARPLAEVRAAAD